MAPEDTPNVGKVAAATCHECGCDGTGDECACDGYGCTLCNECGGYDCPCCRCCLCLAEPPASSRSAHSAWLSQAQAPSPHPDSPDA